MQQKRLLSFLIFSLSVFTVSGQSPDTASGHKDHVALVFSGGAQLMQFYNNDFYDYQTQLIKVDNAVVLGGGYRVSQWGPHDTIPTNFTYNNYRIGPSFAIGFDWHSSSAKWLHTILEAGFCMKSGNYAYTANYGEYNNIPADVAIYDTVKASYKESSFFFKYKFQPTYKFLFFSLSVGLDFNLVSVNVQKKEWQDYVIVGESSHNTYTYDTIYTATNNNYYGFHLTVPLQVGLGAIIKCKRLLFKPGFYFTDYFSQGYYCYNLSLDIEDFIK